jgi:hypothetical protein
VWAIEQLISSHFHFIDDVVSMSLEEVVVAMVAAVAVAVAVAVAIAVFASARSD